MKYKTIPKQRELWSYLTTFLALLVMYMAWVSPAHAAISLPAGSIGVSYSQNVLIPSNTPDCSDGINFQGNPPVGMGVMYTGCTMTFFGTPRSAGNFSFIFTAYGSPNVATSYTLFIQGYATNTSLSASATSSSYGNPVTLTANISGGVSASGNVTFKDGSNTIGSASVSGNTASLTISTLTPGSHSLTAVYGGDGRNDSSTSSSVSVTVDKVNPTISVSPSDSSPVVGSNVNLTANLSSSLPTSGTVTFKDGGTTIGSVSVSGTSATLTTSSLTTGPHSITAVYSGDGNNYTATSSAVNVNVFAAPALALTANSTTVNLGSNINFNATLTSGASPTGTVTFKDGSATIGTVSLSGTTASFNISTLAAGPHSITAIYSGDSNNRTATSSVVNVTVIAAPTLALNASQSSITLGSSLTFTTSLATGVSPTGTVMFKDGATTIGSATLSGTSASFSTSALSVGQHSITAVYSGDSNNLSATSSAVIVTVVATPTLVLSASQSSITLGGRLTFTASLATGASPTGTVTFKDGATTIGSATLSGTSASFSTSALSVGQHAITAVYSGDANNQAATSGTVNVTVTATPGLTLSASQSTLNFGSAITLTANLSAGASPTGTVTFKDGTTTIGSGNLAGSAASLVISNLSVGTHSLTATYSGDANNAIANSGAITVVVNALVLSPSITSVSPSSGPAAGGTTVTINGSNLRGVTSVTFGGAAATIVASSATSITVTTTAHAAGTVDVILTSNTGAATASKAYTFAALPDPTKDVAVMAAVTAQTQSARMFANTQLNNFTQRLDALRSNGGAASSFGLTFNNRTRDVSVDTDWARNGDFVAYPENADQAQSGSLRGLRSGMKKTALGAEKSTPNEPARASNNNEALPDMPTGNGEIRQPLSLWIGGAVDFGEQKPGAGQNGLRFTTSGISFGGDYRLSETLTLGLGFGYSRSNSETDNLGSKSIGQGFSTVAYGTLRPLKHWYIDGLLGYGILDFDLTRYTPGDGGSVKGSRRGSQTFASLTSGYEFEGDSWMLAPYGRLDMVRTSLNQFSETGGASALTYFKQTISSDAVSLGLRGEVRYALDIGTLAPQAQIAYQQGLQGNGRAGIAYANLADTGPAYFVPDSSQDNKQWLSNLGFRLLLKSGLTISMYYSHSIANALVSSQSVSLTLSGRF